MAKSFYSFLIISLGQSSRRIIAGLLYLSILHLWIQPTVDGNYSEKDGVCTEYA
jgi:hypothetical protein